MRTREIAAALALAATAGCSHSAPAGGAAGGAMAGMPPTPVQVAAVHPTPVADTTEYVGTMKSLQSTVVQSQTDGQIVNIYVTSGQHVEAGAPIARIDSGRQQAAVQSQQAQVAAQQAAVTYAQQQADREQQLYQAGAVSKQELEQAQTALATAQAGLKSLQAQAQQQQEQLRYYSVAAPMAGIIGDVPVRVGFQVTTSTVLTTIDRNQTLELNVSVPVERTPDLKTGLPVEVWSSDGQRQLGSAAVSFISPRVDDTTQTVLVKAEVPNPAGLLRAGQYVRARVVWNRAPAIEVPVTAATSINGQYFVFTVQEAGGHTVAHQQPVSIGRIDGNNYVVTSGLKDGDRVVVSGAEKLRDGAPIAPQG